ncbi:MAG: hypothetical protein ABJE66_37805 [Deltaproteobacteria bacterium]
MVRRARDRSQRLGTPDRIEDHGLVTLRGTVKQLGTPLTAPLTGRGCVAYRATGRTFTKVGHRKEVDAEETETAMTPFVLVTKHGEVTVDGTTCELPTRSEPIIPRKLELEQKFMKRVMLIGSADTAGFDEIVVKPGMKIAVYGVVREEVTSSGGETGFREAPKQLRISGEPIVIDLD